MPKFNVYLMTPYCTWEDIEAEDETEAIAQCDYPPEFDLADGCEWVAVELDEE